MTPPSNKWVVTAAIIVGLLVVWASLMHEREPKPQNVGPWVFGPSNARWTITEYADLECPFCKTYTPELKAWVLQQSDVNLVWHHLPLDMHGSAALLEAKQVECAGRLGGVDAFWDATSQVFERTRSNGLGYEGDLDITGVDRLDLQSCAAGDVEVALFIRQHIEEASKTGITATPSLLIRDNNAGKTVKLEGAADGTTLLSAIDWLSQ